VDAAVVTSVEVRAELQRLLERDLLGPWDGPTEELPPGVSPAERYLLGRLVPRTSPSAAGRERRVLDEAAVLDVDPSLVDREAMVDVSGDDTDVESEQAVRWGSMAASSMGLAFSVPDDVDTVAVRARWGRYATGPSEVHETEQGRPRSVWQRTPAGGEPVQVPVDVEGDGQAVPDPSQERVELRWSVRHRGRLRIVDLALVNGQGVPSQKVDEARLYQVSLTVTAADGGSAVFVGHNDPDLSTPPSDSDPERQHLELLNRRHRLYGRGRTCAVDADVRDGEQRAWRLTTTSFPAADVQLVVPGDPAAMPGLVLDMARLGSPELARDDLMRALRPLVGGYRSWLDAQQQRLGDPEIARYGDAGAHAVAGARALADRLERAIDLLRDDAQAREAFRFANQAMALQRVRSELVRRRMADPSVDPDRLLTELDVPGNRSWRPFQLAFVLLCLPGLADPSHPDAGRGDDAELQLLFFPTGGGKTEAYLGLTAFTLAIRRLQGVVGEGVDARDGSDGVAVLMRYTLRLLTAQQFQRAAALICACEHLRADRIASGDGRWGTRPFRIGLWVGSKVTPNSYDEARRQVDDARGSGGPGGVLQLIACPWCGSPLSHRDLRTDDVRRRVLLHCSDTDGRCAFSRRQSPDEGLPVLTVDEEIYRLTPALMIGTVDKFAQLPWKAATGLLFGIVECRCPRHGWQNPDFAGFCGSRHQAAGGRSSEVPEPAIRLRPPDLIIQDELHLIADALGSMVGLYETGIDHLATRPPAQGGARPIRPVVVASTATVRRARDQVRQVFDRTLAVFPPQVLDAGETFFSTTVPATDATPARRYRGICAPGERLKAVEIRVAAALMEHAQALFDEHGMAADPYMTLVDYFTSTRELAGMRRLVDDDVADRLSSLKVRTRRRRPQVAELTSRMPSDRIAQTLADLERPFDPTLDTTVGLAELQRRYREKEDVPPRALDVLLATSMLQVGVDVQRLGLMVVTGQPKNTAEYIQATSRVGRDRTRPGLVVTIYQWSRPRDLAHYESFAHDHATFGLRVEGLTTTPFSDRALDRGLTGLLVGVTRHTSPDAEPNPAAHHVPLDPTAVGALLDLVEQRAGRVTGDVTAGAQAREQLQRRIDRWQVRRAKLQTGKLGYDAAQDVDGLLREPTAGPWDLWSAPRSLREVEPEIILQLDQRDASIDGAPGWVYVKEEA
jgi:hypothetical protein